MVSRTRDNHGSREIERRSEFRAKSSFSAPWPGSCLRGRHPSAGEGIMKKSPVALGFALVLAVGTAFAQSAPSLADRLASVGRHYGDANGNIPLNLIGGGVLYVATADGQD